MAPPKLALQLLAILALAACGQREEGELNIAFIDTAENLFADGLRLSAGGQHVRAATSAGLVALDQDGEVIPALADRWIVTDDGRSFIFRLREGTWPDGSPLTAESVSAQMKRVIRDLRGTSLGLDLEPVEEVVAMAGRVVEIRLDAPVPMFLQLLAQPELVLDRGEEGAGPMRFVDEARLEMKPPSDRGLPEEEDWAEHLRAIRIHAADAETAISQFDDGQVDVVLGGRIGALPLADTGPLSRGTVWLDPAIGLFGLQVRTGEGFLGDEFNREALAMAIDRDALASSFSIAGWLPTTRIVAPGLPGDPGFILERWADDTMEERRAEASQRVANWIAGNATESGGQGEAPKVTLTVAIGDEVGLEQLFRELAGQFAMVGIELQRVEEGGNPDLVLVDRVARYAAPRWFLNQFNCSLKRGLCSEDADYLVELALGAPDSQTRESLLAEAEAELTLANVYIPFGSPLRFSLVRSGVEDFAANPWAFHPLPPLATLPR